MAIIDQPPSITELQRSALPENTVTAQTTPELVNHQDLALNSLHALLHPYYTDPTTQDTRLIFDAHRVNFYRGAGNIEQGGVNLNIMHTRQKHVYGTALFNAHGQNLDGLSISRASHNTSEIALITDAMKIIRMNLSGLVHEYRLDPLTLLSALPRKSH